MSEFINKHQKLFTIILAVTFAISLIPIFIVAGYDAAAGDDYNYGAQPHLIYLATGSALDAIKAAYIEMIGTWYSWQGTWFDVFVFCLHPEVFSDSAYVIVPYIFVVLQTVCFLCFAHHFIKVKMKIDGLYWLEIGLLFLLFCFQLVPSQKSAFFWWVGSVHYAMPMCMALIGIVLGDRYLSDHKIKDLAALTIIATLIGGATYPAALLLILVVFLLWLAGFVLFRDRNRKNFFLIIPFIMEAIGLFISVIAPGNANRSASDIAEGAVPSGGAIATIIKSIVFSVQDAVTLFVADKTFCLILFIAVGIVSGDVIRNKMLERGSDSEFAKLFAHPLLFCIVMFLLNASMYAPRLYAGGSVSSGYYNFDFEVFLMCTCASIIYVEGWFFSKNAAYSKKVSVCTSVTMCILALVIAFAGRHGIKGYTDYVCFGYYYSGQAADYKEQIALQRLLMEEEGVDDVVVPGINDVQGPLMHMPVTDNPDKVTNYMTCKFYGKKSCRSIPRDEWIKEYGAKYGY